MDFTFFFSYARDDEASTPEIKEFFEDLNREVRKLVPIDEETRAKLDPAEKNPPAGYFDQDANQAGDSWPIKLADGLKAIPVMVSLYSPTYFRRHYCGKEFKVFEIRKLNHQQRTGQQAPPSVILPVIWVPPGNYLPKQIGDLQYHTGKFSYQSPDFKKIYEEEGLELLKRISKYRDDYLVFLNSLAKQVVKAAAEKLDPLPERPDLKSIDDAFAIPAAVHTAPAAPAAVSTVAAGPGSVSFVYVAATKKEIQDAGGASWQHYGAATGWEWIPYQPRDAVNRVGLLASQVAVTSGLFPTRMDLDDKLVTRLEEAKKSNSLVVLLVDPRTLTIDLYRKRMEQFDGVNLSNSAAVIVWDADTAASAVERAKLEELVADVFDDNYAVRTPKFFRPEIRSMDSLRKELADALEALQLAMLSKGSAQRPTPNAGPLPVL